MVSYSVDVLTTVSWDNRIIKTCVCIQLCIKLGSLNRASRCTYMSTLQSDNTIYLYHPVFVTRAQHLISSPETIIRLDSMLLYSIFIRHTVKVLTNVPIYFT